LDDVQRAHASFIALLRDGKGQTTPVSLASATTTDIGAQNSTFVEISGTTTITSFGTTYSGVRFLRFAAALTLTHNASSLILPTGANITTAANDTAIAVPAQSGSGWAVISYQRANGNALVSATDYLNTTRIDLASATTTNLTSGAPNTRHINITGTTTITGFTVAAGLTYFVRFNAALTLTNNAAIITQTGANITTTAGATCILRSTASNTVEVLSYSAASTSTPANAGTAAVGSADTFARGDHVHNKEVTSSGSAPLYGARAWVIFNGTGTPSIYASGNVTSITDNGTGDYTITFTTALPSANYSVALTVDNSGSSAPNIFIDNATAPTTTTLRIGCANNAGARSDPVRISVVVFA
jgi:hypothetical protein